MLTFEETNAIGQILDSTWGKGGSGLGSVTHSMQGDLLVVKYQCIVTFASERSLSSQTKRLAEESVSLLSKVVTGLKKQFKEKTGNTLKLKEGLNKDSVELVSATSVNPRKIAYYRRFVEFKVEN
jgi:hypothetical protein